MRYNYKKQTSLSFNEAEAKAREELKKEGFGIITEIDARDTFKKKLDIDFENYTILGACHPTTAHRVLQVSRDLGVMLPCNVLIYEDNDKIYVSTILPTIMMEVIGNQDLNPIIKEVEIKLKKVIDAI